MGFSDVLGHGTYGRYIKEKTKTWKQVLGVLGTMKFGADKLVKNTLFLLMEESSAERIIGDGYIAFKRE